jgi:4a-hydroxytetrahydrobiopterin dehydratase
VGAVFYCYNEKTDMKWTTENQQLVREFEFDNFVEAIDFVKKIADLAEESQHHPDILIHSYNKVKIMIYTHDQNKITDKDYALADKIDKLT